MNANLRAMGFCGVDNSVSPPKVSYFNSTVKQTSSNSAITLKSNQSDNVVMSADNSVRMIGNNLATQTLFELKPE